MRLRHEELIQDSYLNEILAYMESKEGLNDNFDLISKYDIKTVFHYIMRYGNLSTLERFVKIQNHKCIFEDSTYLNVVAECIVYKKNDKVEFFFKNILFMQNINKVFLDKYLKPIFEKYIRLKKLNEIIND